MELIRGPRQFFQKGYQEVSPQDIVVRIFSYVKNVDEPTFEYDAGIGDYSADRSAFDHAQRRWAGCDRLIRILADKCGPTLCYDAAIELIHNEENNPYLTNTGIALLGQPAVHKAQFDTPESLRTLLDLFYSFVPKFVDPLNDYLIAAPQNDPKIYNLIQAIEAMLNCNESLGPYIDSLPHEEKLQYRTEQNRVSPFSIIYELHNDLIAKCRLLADVPDMKGTLFAKLFPRYTYIPGIGKIDLA